jgi:hypothetical protein
MGVSHPSEAMPLQSKNPALHAPCPHVPALHVGVEFAVLQGVRHPPQWFGSFVMLVSHPFDAIESQSL